MMDDAASLDRQSAYLEQIRALGRPQRFAGFIACLVGVMMMVLARYKLDNAPWLLWPGVADGCARLDFVHLRSRPSPDLGAEPSLRSQRPKA